MTLGPNSSHTRSQARRVTQWDVIRAARAFYGRPLVEEDLQRIRAAQSVKPWHASSVRQGGDGAADQVRR